MIKFLISGIYGKMGHALCELLAHDETACAVCGVDTASGEVNGIPVFASFAEVNVPVDVIIDFSSPAALEPMLTFATQNHTPLVIATTGYTAEQLARIDEASKQVAVFRSANFSLGIPLLAKLVREASAFLGEAFDIEIIEKHHNAKKDAPSGTALSLAESANVPFDGDKPYLYGRQGQAGPRGNEIGIHAVRGGTIVGEHEVLFCGEDEIITLSHSARSKRVFAVGAIRAGKFLAGKPAGKYNMDDLLA